ncbi:MAG: DUF433 domain-containing protein [Proteobacteria bacterium]|nr:DUF433 domain-containing protein [Pseudomonadota bacterium]
MDRIELNPRVCNGGPVIKGTRIPVFLRLHSLEQFKNHLVILSPKRAKWVHTA